MIWALKGTLLEKDENSLVIDVNGVMYDVTVASRHLSEFEAERDAFVYIREVSREGEAVELIGFTGKEERSLYDALIKVSGIGPRNALKILDFTDLKAFSGAIESKNVGFLKSLPGIGVKTAERMLVELAGKLKATEEGYSQGYFGDAVDTLTALGFSRQVSFDAVKRAIDNGSRELEEIVKSALSSIKKS